MWAGVDTVGCAWNVIMGWHNAQSLVHDSVCPTQAQYVFIHDALEELITCGDTAISSSNLRIKMGKMHKIIPEKAISGFSDQFKVRAGTAEEGGGAGRGREGQAGGRHMYVIQKLFVVALCTNCQPFSWANSKCAHPLPPFLLPLLPACPFLLLSQLLEKVSRQFNETDCSDALQQYNHEKNRYPDRVPCEPPSMFPVLPVLACLGICPCVDMLHV